MNKEEFIEYDGKVDLVNLLLFIKNNLNSCIKWCEKLHSKTEVDDKVFEVQQPVIVMTEQIQYYDKTIKCLNIIITSLEKENPELNKEVFTSKLIDYFYFRYYLRKIGVSCLVSVVY